MERQIRALFLTLTPGKKNKIKRKKKKSCFLYSGANNGHVINLQERLGLAVLLQEKLCEAKH